MGVLAEGQAFCIWAIDHCSFCCTDVSELFDVVLGLEMQSPGIQLHELGARNVRYTKYRQQHRGTKIYPIYQRESQFRAKEYDLGANSTTKSPPSHSTGPFESQTRHPSGIDSIPR